ncbi:hypothetical protein PSTG_13487 [Puccinia striiformis f. sp. tritici PST-78]|uniref:Uncharacterized protein n=1 Tax=Puccinia striiformis f. sp. tritici PST-78 TaxID=1165861 RepID=A0A0L0V1F7_9BASI|nr:hypothetical protein PSTG_13487 [Puccinia striiformis f. sp. tritici PST-78]
MERTGRSTRFFGSNVATFVVWQVFSKLHGSLATPKLPNRDVQDRRDAPSTDPFAPTNTNIQSPSRARRESGSNATGMSGTAPKFSPSTRLVLTQQQRHNIF